MPISSDDLTIVVTSSLPALDVESRVSTWSPIVEKWDSLKVEPTFCLPGKVKAFLS